MRAFKLVLRRLKNGDRKDNTVIKKRQYMNLFKFTYYGLETYKSYK